MPHPVARAGADLRLIRAAVFTAVCVLLSAGGHVLASCASVPLWTLGAGFALVLAAVVPLAGRERSLPGITAFLAVGQLALHTLFGLGQRGAGTSGRAVPSEGHLVHFAGQLICDQRPMSAAQARRVITDAGLDPSVHPMGPAAPAPATGGASAAFPHALLPSLPMVLGHLLAALAVGWLLRRGEAALWRLVRLSARSARDVVDAALVRALGAALVLVGLRAPASPAVPARRTRADDESPLRAPELRHSVIRRGPPRCVLAA
ncbi:hypothetical protein J1792_06410 [Streptomyces triculaminicus]|uniref:Integral membrane protein n=2 Tax=Streptomyces TaxID=1883 RepID=A0A939FMB6_9ACTN|nr:MULTISPECIES: hypothetical protein [Streptomyces]MBO0652435.1 hypothetical protein [Streptomyces triculaminicus]QSY51958.1 hypothetical protein J3S04_14690 [Streptomyces griseocarneus]